jgi:RHS repeat-associated protein
MVQHIEYVPFGEVFIEEGNSTWNTPYLFNAKELDEETGLYYYGARYYDPRISLWLSADPLQEKKPWMSPYAYCSNNPINRIDPDGKDDFVFDHNGNFLRIDKTKNDDVLIAQSYDSKNNLISTSYKFADPVNDTQAIKDGTITKIIFVNEEQIGNMLGAAGAFDATNRENEYSYMNKESKGGGKLDFSYSAIPSVFSLEGASSDPLNTPSPMLFIPEGDGYAHNHMNFGNFLWGAAGNSLGFSKLTLKAAAHYNSLMNSPTNGYSPQLDSKDDQLSIGRGVDYSKSHRFNNRTWSSTTGLSPIKKTR